MCFLHSFYVKNPEIHTTSSGGKLHTNGQTDGGYIIEPSLRKLDKPD